MTLERVANNYYFIIQGAYEMSEKIPGYGIVTAMLTPLHQDETVDVPAAKRLVERANDAGIHGIFTMATSGECSRLEDRQQSLLIDTVAQTNDGKSMLYVGVGACGLGQAIRNVRRAEAAGADVLVSTLPYFYLSLTVQEQIDYFRALADSTELPILLYNIPGNVGSSISFEAVQALKDVKNLVGIKDSSGDTDFFDRLMTLRSDDFHVLCGIEFHMARALKMGADGVVPSLSNIYPKAYMRMWDAASRGDTETVDAIQEKIDTINQIHKRAPGKLALMACRKVLLAYEGLGEEYVTRPYAPVPDELRQELLEAAAKLKLE